MKNQGGVGRSVYDLEYLPHNKREKYHMEDMKMLEESSTIHYEEVFELADGSKRESLYWSKGFVVPQTNEKGLIGEIVDISKEKNLKRELEETIKKLNSVNMQIEESNKTDFLTKLYNRKVLEKEVPTLMENCEKFDMELSLLTIYIDHFKQINDNHGHGVGDNVLKYFGKLLKRLSRSDDIVVRQGGEEFLLFMPKATKDEAKEVAERIRVNLSNKEVWEESHKITVSIGVVECKKGESLESFLTRGDEALYKAKDLGRDRAYVCKVN